jgi:hypothetical protein
VAEADERAAPVKAKAVLIDPQAMTVSWMNEAGAQDFPGAESTLAGTPVERAVPLAELLGVPKALRDAARTGEPRHLHADLVSSAKGSVAIVASVYRLPDGQLLLLMENAFQVSRGARDPEGSSGSRRRR